MAWIGVLKPIEDLITGMNSAIVVELPEILNGIMGPNSVARSSPPEEIARHDCHSPFFARTHLRLVKHFLLLDGFCKKASTRQYPCALDARIYRN
jgi:hypothetical protein